MNRSELPKRLEGQRFVCGPPFQDSKECWKHRRTDPNYLLCYKCSLYESMHRPEIIKETGMNFRTVPSNSSSTTSVFQRSKSKLQEREPVLPYYIHPIRPLSALPAPFTKTSFNKFVPTPLLRSSLTSSSKSTSPLMHLSRPVTAKTEMETMNSSSRPSSPIGLNVTFRLDSERHKLSRPNTSQIHM